MLMEVEKKAIDDFLVEYLEIFKRHRIDNGMNTQIEVKLTPIVDKTVHIHNLPMPIHLKEDLIVELNLMHKYGIFTVLSFSKYASATLAQTKPIGKLRLRVDLIADDYTSNRHSVSTLLDAAQHVAGESLFCQLDCS